MANRKIAFALGLALAFGALQAPNFAYANGGGGGEFEDVGQFIPSQRVEQRVRNNNRSAFQERRTENRKAARNKTRKSEGRGFFRRVQR